eukprot:8765006-Alexandrium_andersonii.AAC.1
MSVAKAAAGRPLSRARSRVRPNSQTAMSAPPPGTPANMSGLAHLATQLRTARNRIVAQRLYTVAQMSNARLSNGSAVATGVLAMKAAFTAKKGLGQGAPASTALRSLANHKAGVRVMTASSDGRRPSMPAALLRPSRHASSTSST